MDIYISQIYDVAQINKTKYTCVRQAVWFVVIALASQLSIIAYIFARKDLKIIIYHRSFC